MSLSDKLEKLRKKPDPLEHLVMRMFDPSMDSPDIFYKMDEADGVQVLRKFDESSGKPQYRGTYEVLLKEERYDMHCIVLRRIANEDIILTDDTMQEELGELILAQYVPAYGHRLLLRDIPDSTAAWLKAEYEKRR